MNPFSAVSPGSPQAQSTASLWWFMLALLGAIFVAVMLTLLYALLRGDGPSSEKRMSFMVGASTFATIAILVGLTFVSVLVAKNNSGNSVPPNSLTIEVTGNQWWWSVRYLNDDPRRVVVTANEIHVPVGRPVAIRGVSQDVIHSFWVPGLQGKRDLIPSRVTTEWFQAERAGRYRGQCAEFCGLQHAHMGFWVIAESAREFNAWMERQLQPAIAPDDEMKRRGQQVFLANACVLCHAIQGTTAAAQVGPDLTHLASRFTIAAATLPRTKGALAGWITDPQKLKPGNHMATVPLKTEDLQPLLEYLESLQ